MARTIAELVKVIMLNTALTDVQIDAYIVSSNVMVTNTLGTTLGTDVLAEIERWLTAHMITATNERLAKKEGAGGAEIEYAGIFGVGLESTQYGQMVLTLDTTGVMRQADGGKKRARVTAVKSFDD